MYQRIAVAYDQSPEAARALTAAVRLAKALNASLQSVTAMEKLPPYAAYAASIDAPVMVTLEEDRRKYYDHLQDQARAAAAREGLEIATNLIDGEEVDSIVNFVCEHKVDLLVIGIHRRSSRVSRMWSTVYTIAQNVPCSVLGVH